MPYVARCSLHQSKAVPRRSTSWHSVARTKSGDRRRSAIYWICSQCSWCDISVFSLKTISAVKELLWLWTIIKSYSLSASHVGRIFLCEWLTRREENWHEVCIPTVHLFFCLYNWHCFSQNVVADSRHVGTVTGLLSQNVVVTFAIPICLGAFYVARDAVLTVCCTSVCKVSKWLSMF